MYVSPVLGTAQKFRDAGGRSYLYYLDQSPGEQMPTHYPQPHLGARGRINFRAMHGHDRFYAFALHAVWEAPGSLAAIMPPNDIKVARSFVHFSTTFAKTR